MLVIVLKYKFILFYFHYLFDFKIFTVPTFDDDNTMMTLSFHVQYKEKEIKLEDVYLKL